MARKKRLVVMVEPETYERLKQQARESDRSLGSCVREALAEYGMDVSPEPVKPKPIKPPRKRYNLPPHLEKIRGLLAGSKRDVLKELLEERRRDRERENAELRSR